VTELHYRSLCDVAAALRDGEVSAVEATRHQLERIERLDPELRSFVSVTPDAALTRAEALDRERARGRECGPLHGVPIAIKDLIDTEGVHTTCGMRIFAHRVPDADATVVTRLKRAGAVLLGKLKLTEGAFSSHHPDVTPPRNPWGAERWPGVSSSGSGVATAAGLCFGSLGTDTGGSIRFPSAANGVFGLKPTYGRVSRHGVLPLAESLDHIGPMARSARDAARLHGVLAGHDPRDPTSLKAPVPDDERDLGTSVAGLRVGIDWRYAATGVDAVVVGALEDALELLADSGAEVRELDMPEVAPLVEGWALTAGAEAACAHASWFPAERAQYGSDLAALLDLGHRATALRYVELQRSRERFRAELDARFEDSVDVIVAPAMPTPPPRLVNGTLGSGPRGTADFLTFTAPFDYSGHPCITVPAGFTDEGLPLAFQIIGPHLAEGLLLRVAHHYERAGGTRACHPLS